MQENSPLAYVVIPSDKISKKEEYLYYREATANCEEDKNYIYYIYEHIKNVKTVWKASIQYLTGEYWLDDYVFNNIDILIHSHDESKSSDEEFYGYRQYFYPKKSEIKDNVAFEVAWNHHYKSNPHHWEYWVTYDGLVLDMPFIYIFEMLCDWSAMSLKFKDLPYEFYNKNKNKIRISENTRNVLLQWLPIFDLTIENIRISENTRNVLLQWLPIFDLTVENINK